MEKISWNDLVKNEEVLHTGKGRSTLQTIDTEGNLTGLVTSGVETAF